MQHKTNNTKQASNKTQNGTMEQQTQEKQKRE